MLSTLLVDSGHCRSEALLGATGAQIFVLWRSWQPSAGRLRRDAAGTVGIHWLLLIHKLRLLLFVFKDSKDCNHKKNRTSVFLLHGRIR